MKVSEIYLLSDSSKLIPEILLDFGGAKCQKYNIVGPTELDNLELANLSVTRIDYL